VDGRRFDEARREFELALAGTPGRRLAKAGLDAVAAAIDSGRH
jgi:hypothetical protein